MLLKKKNYYKPFYKQFLDLRENVQNRKKILGFKKQKWSKFINSYKTTLRRYRKYKQQDQIKYLVTKYPNKFTSYKNRYKNSMLTTKKFKLFYGGLLKKETKKIIYKTKKTINRKIKILKTFESRLDTILYRSKFCFSIKNARQLIVHKKILVNKKIINSKSYKVTSGDLISIVPEFKNNIIKNFKRSHPWPIPPKYLFINYKTMEILMGNINNNNILTSNPFNLNLEKIIINYNRI